MSLVYCSKRDYSKTLQQLANALYALSGAGDQRVRLSTAISICLVRVSPELDLPDALKGRFAAFLNSYSPDLSATDHQKVSEAISAVAGFDDDEVCEAIKFIIMIFAEISCYAT